MNKAVFRLAVGLAVLLVAVAVWRWVSHGPPTGGDWAQYMSHALALAEGRDYGDIGYLYTPAQWVVGPPAYPPGLPLMLAPLLAVFGPFSTAPLLLMHAFLFLFVFCAGRYFAREDGPAIGWGVAGMLGAGFLLADRPNVVGSDLALCAFVWSALLLSDRSGAWPWKRTGGITALGTAAILCRIAAAPLVPAMALQAVIKRRTLGVRTLLPLVLWAVALWFVLRGFGPGDAPVEMVTGSQSPGASPLSDLGSSLEWIANRLRRKVSVYQDSVSQAFLYPVVPSIANGLYHILAFGLAVVGLVGWVRRRAASLAVAFAAATVAMLALAPVWQPRYAWVLTPFLCFGLLRGLVVVVAWSEGGIKQQKVERRWAIGLVFSAVLVSMTVVTAVIRPTPSAPPEADAWQEVDRRLATFESRGQVRVASDRPRKATWFTGAPAMPIVFRDLDLFLREAEERRITHVVVTSALAVDGEVERWETWVADFPSLFVPGGEVGSLRVYELRGYVVP